MNDWKSLIPILFRLFFFFVIPLFLLFKIRHFILLFAPLHYVSFRLLIVHLLDDTIFLNILCEKSRSRLLHFDTCSIFMYIEASFINAFQASLRLSSNLSRKFSSSTHTNTAYTIFIQPKVNRKWIAENTNYLLIFIYTFADYRTVLNKNKF